MLPRKPAAWTPPPAPGLTGPYAANRALTDAELWTTPDGVGPEDVAVDAAGRVYAGLADGRILRWRSPDGGEPETLANTGGRPLGIELDRDGSLVVCDAKRGLLRLHLDGEPTSDARVEPLVTEFEGRPLAFTNNADIARDGTVYFTDSSVWGVDRYRDDLLEHRPYGRLFAYAPRRRELTLVADGFFFANGVALAGDEESVLVAETGAYRITRVWLNPARRGEREAFVENLPGFPDNLSRGPSGLVWVGIPNPRNAALDRLLPYPFLRWAVSALPERWQPQAARYGLVLAFDASGRLRHALHDPTGRLDHLTSAREHAGMLYMGSLTEPCVARVRVPG
jgi:sugar lactone lactonase YvrE